MNRNEKTAVVDEIAERASALGGTPDLVARLGAHARLVLSVDLIGQAVSVEVDAADVKAY